jgi:hypothetical protein
MPTTFEGDYFLAQVLPQLNRGYIDERYSEEGAARDDKRLISRLFDKLKVNISPDYFNDIWASKQDGPEAFRETMSSYLKPLCDYFLDGEPPYVATLFPELYAENSAFVEDAVFTSIKSLFVQTLMLHIQRDELDASFTEELGAIEKPFFEAFERKYINQPFTPETLHSIEAKQAYARIFQGTERLSNLIEDKIEELKTFGEDNPLSEDEMQSLEECSGAIRQYGQDAMQGEMSHQNLVNEIQAEVTQVNGILNTLPSGRKSPINMMADSVTHVFSNVSGSPKQNSVSNDFKARLKGLKDEIQKQEERSLQSMEKASRKISPQ